MIPRNHRRHVNRGHKRPGESGGPLMLNIRVRHLKRKGDPATTAEEVREALQHLLDFHEMPRGWQFMAVNWKNPTRFGTEWETGWPDRAKTDDEIEFLEAFTKAVQSKLRMAEVWRVDAL